MLDSIAAPRGASFFRSPIRAVIRVVAGSALLCLASLAQAQVSITAPGTPVSQNFDTLSTIGTANAWTDGSTLPGWYAAYSGGTGTFPGTYRADAGTSTTGALYSYGSAGSTERALGSTSSGTPGTIYYAWRLVNNTGSTITSLTINYTGEQWRNGGNTTAQKLTFEYQIGAAGAVTGANTPSTGWTADPTLDFVGPIATATAGALDGNAVANRTAKTDTLTINLPAGQEIWLRWYDVNDAGTDHGLAIDDVSVTAGGSGSSTPSLSINNVTLPEGNSGATLFNFTVTLSASPTADVTVQCTTVDGTATAADNDFAAGGSQLKFVAGTTTLTQTVTVIVAGDTKVEPDETFSLVLSSPVNATITPGGGIGTILNDDFVLTPIHDIQGNGATSPLVGNSIVTRGIVTGVKSNGFFIQEPDANVDADPNTSEGIFVFTSSAPPAAATVGNLVQVGAKVQEFVPSTDLNSPPVTELSGSPTVTIVSTGNALPTPITLTSNDFINQVDNLEKYEGMRVRVASLTAVSGTDGFLSEANATSTSDGTFYGVLTGTPRPFREAGIDVSDPLPAGSPCCVPRFDSNPERLRVDSDALGGAAINVSTGAVLTSVVGPLDYQYRTYMIDIDPPAVSPAPTVTPGMAVTPTAAPLAGEVTIASFNMERFYDTTNDPATSDVTLTSVAFNMRLKKASLAIRNFLRTPDIVGVEEMENLTTLQAVAAQISSDAIAAGQPDPQYTAYLMEGNDIGGIDVGFLVKGAAATATTHHADAIAVTQYGKNSLFVNPDSSTALLNDRPTLELVATISNLAGDSFPVTVYVNHLRSLNGQNDPTAGSNGWPTEGDRVRAKRQAQAVELANLIQTRQANFPADHIVVLGDFNAFDVNDGYGDSMGTIAGTPAPDNQTVVTGDGTSPVSPALTNLSNTPAPAERYSYSFGGNAQSIDHILINSTLTGFAHRIEHARIDADFPEILRGDATTPARISDHDPALLYLDALPTAKVSVTKTATPNPVAAGAQITYSIGVANNGLGTAGNVTLTDALPAGTTFASLASAAGWSCITPSAGTNGTVTCTIASLAPSANAAFTLVAGVAAGTVDGTSISNTATVTVTTNDDGSGPLSATAAVDVLTPVNGSCGTANGGSFTTLASDDPALCASGAVTGFGGSGPWTWTCSGSGGGTPSPTCTANIRTWTVSTTISGAGGTISAPAQSAVNHGSATTFTVTPLGGYSIATVVGTTCTPTLQSGNTWTSGAITADCTITASFSANPVSGICGSDNGRTLSSAPTNLCSAGAATALVGNGPWTWSCQGSGGGTTANCAANATTGSITVLGATTITNGDAAPSTAKGTDFGNVTVGTQAARSFTIGNPAGAPAPTGAAPKTTDTTGAIVATLELPNAAGDLVVSGITSNNPAFIVSGGTGTVPKGGSATFTVTFNATGVGVQNATISIASNDASTPTFIFAVTANAIAAPPATAVAAPLLDAKTLLLLIAALAAIGHFALRRREAAK